MPANNTIYPDAVLGTPGLPVYTTQIPTDVVPIVDITNNLTKRITLTSLFDDLSQNVTGGLVTASGGMLIGGSNAVGTLPLRVRSVAGQTVEMAQFQDSSGNAKVVVSASGTFALRSFSAEPTTSLATDVKMYFDQAGGAVNNQWRFSKAGGSYFNVVGCDALLTAGKIPKASALGELSASLFSESGTAITLAGNLVISGTGALMTTYNTSGQAAPFFVRYEAMTFSGTVDDIFTLSYNYGQVVPSKPTFSWTIEGDFNPGAGDHLFEHHWNFTSAGGGLSYRPLEFSINLTTNNAAVIWKAQTFEIIARGAVNDTFKCDTATDFIAATKLTLGTIGAPSYRLMLAGASVGTVFAGINSSSGAANDICYYATVGNAVTGEMFPLNLNVNASLGAHSILANANNANATAHSQLEIITGGASAGDPYLQFTITGAINWTIGVDNSAADAFKIGADSQPGGTTYISISTAGAVTIAQTLAVSSLTSGRLALVGASGLLTDDSNILYDAAGDAIGLGATTYRMTVSGASRGSVFYGATGSAGAANDIIYYASISNAISGEAFPFDLSVNASTGSHAVLRNANTGTGTAHTYLEVLVGGASAGDPFIQYTISAVINVCTGLDNSDSDKWGVWASATPGSSPMITINPSTFLATVYGTFQQVRTAITLAAAAASFSASGKNVVTLTGDGGGNTVTSITGGVDGQQLMIIGVDALVTISDASTLKLNGNWVSAADKTLTLIFNGTNWYELARSTN